MVLVVKLFGFKSPVPFEMIRSSIFFATSKIENFKSLVTSVAH
jgi:hypothetical protein